MNLPCSTFIQLKILTTFRILLHTLMIPWKHLPMADERKSISGSVLKGWKALMQKHKEKNLFNIHILSFYFWCTFISFMYDTAGMGVRWPFNVSWITLDSKQNIHTNRNKLIVLALIQTLKQSQTEYTLLL